MQTRFSSEQLHDPDTAIANDILRRCVHCGMCTATCPTFVTLGDERDSPRGRIYLIKDMLEEARPAATEEVVHLDRCLSCLSCATTCPSGVDYMHLIDHARSYVEATYRRPLGQRLLRRMVAAILPHPNRMRVALALARLAWPFRFLLAGQARLTQSLRAMLELAHRQRRATESPLVESLPAELARGRVAVLAGCAQQVLAPEITGATLRLLARLGYQATIPEAAGCCGALVHHMGDKPAALAAARRNVAAWSAELYGVGLDAVVTDTSGCGTTLKDYGFLLRNDPFAEAAAKLSQITYDISEFLLRAGYEPSRSPTGLTVAYHAACSLQHGQKITEAPKHLLQKAGFVVVEPRDPHLCCGSAGTYNMMQPEIAGQLRRRKLDTLRAKNPDVIVAGNIGCLTQLGGDGLPAIHLVEMLDWMAGGPKPRAIGQDHSV